MPELKFSAKRYFTERVGFEPTNSFLLNDFESFAFDHSATSPPVYKYALNEEKNSLAIRLMKDAGWN